MCQVEGPPKPLIFMEAILAQAQRPGAPPNLRLICEQIAANPGSGQPDGLAIVSSRDLRNDRVGSPRRRIDIGLSMLGDHGGNSHRIRCESATRPSGGGAPRRDAVVAPSPRKITAGPLENERRCDGLPVSVCQRARGDCRRHRAPRPTAPGDEAEHSPRKSATGVLATNGPTSPRFGGLGRPGAVHFRMIGSTGERRERSAPLAALRNVDERMCQAQSRLRPCTPIISNKARQRDRAPRCANDHDSRRE